MNYNKIVLSYSCYTVKRDYVHFGKKYAELWFYATPLLPRLAHVNPKRAWRRWYTNSNDL